MKVDLKRLVATYSARHGELELVTVPPLRYLMIDGHGDPNVAAEYEDSLATLYPMAYALKFLSKKELERDYVVPPLEALWWAEDMAAFTTAREKSQWDWTVLSLVPDWIEEAHLEAARAIVERKGAPRLDALRVETLDEGLCVQTLHLGPYDAEGPVLARMHDEVIPAHGLVRTGRHHEIYLSDPRRAAPERLRTILRQPVAEA